MKKKFILVTAILVLCVVKSSLAQDSNLLMLLPEHELLQRFEGEWQFEKLSAAAEPTKLGSGEVHAEMLGGYFVVCKWSGELYGGDYAAVQTLGYDLDQKAYRGLWIDNSMNYQWQLEGALDPETKEFVLEASGPGPDGGTGKFRERYQFPSADSIVIVAEMMQGDDWVAFMTTRLTRKE